MIAENYLRAYSWSGTLLESIGTFENLTTLDLSNITVRGTSQILLEI